MMVSETRGFFVSRWSTAAKESQRADHAGCGGLFSGAGSAAEGVFCARAANEQRDAHVGASRGPGQGHARCCGAAHFPSGRPKWPAVLFKDLFGTRGCSCLGT